MLETTTIVAIIIGLTEVIKRTFGITKRYQPIIALALGLAYVIGLSDLGIQEAIFTGIMAGLSASGLYAASKTVAGK